MISFSFPLGNISKYRTRNVYLEEVYIFNGYWAGLFVDYGILYFSPFPFLQSTYNLAKCNFIYYLKEICKGATSYKKLNLCYCICILIAFILSFFILKGARLLLTKEDNFNNSSVFMPFSMTR